MPKEFSRMQRVDVLIQRELAEIIRREVNTSALGMVTISEVHVSPDLKFARIYVTTLGVSGNDSAENSVRHLNSIAKSLRYQLAHRLTLRTTPSLEFVYDHSAEYANRLSALIKEANKD
jgi:ribosome-binding factor A